MKKILQKIFNARQSKGQLVFAGVGFMLGLLLLLLSVHLYIKINELLAPNESASDYLIINKKVGMMNTLTLARADFAPEEIKEIEKQSFTKKIGSAVNSVQSNNWYNVSLSFGVTALAETDEKRISAVSIKAFR